MGTASDSSPGLGKDEITLLDLWRVIWDGKFIIVAITSVFTLLAIAYALMATEWYRANTMLMPADDQSMSDIRGQLGGLAALAGITTRNNATRVDEALAVLRSSEFARRFIVEQELQEKFLAQGKRTDKAPDMRDAVKFFHENVLRISEDRDSGIVTVGAQWTDAATSAEWANAIVSSLNKEMRERASMEAQANIDFLKAEIATNNVVALEQSISRIMEGEMQKLMLARGTEQYAFRIIDHAQPPLTRSRPKRTLVVLSVLVVSGMFSMVVVFIRSAFLGRSSS
jgi:uncharacterized protein involved in exopolysaccharide biosynthesis